MRQHFSVLLLCLCATIFSVSLKAQTAREAIHENINRAAGNYYAYPTDIPAQTAAPKGYVPFYINHYARHGSRWLIDPGQYNRPVEVLTKAKQYGKLTPAGLRALEIADSVAKMAVGRYGELSPLGARQHKGIGARMYKNFPQVFAKNAPVDARSTVIIRCILSMMNECLSLQAAEPTLQIKTDASHHDMYYMNNEDQPEIQKHRGNPQIHDIHNEFRKARLDNTRFINQLFNDSQYAADSIGVNQFVDDLFQVAGNMQSLDTDLDLKWLFTEEEFYNLWANSNIAWHFNYANSPLSNGKMPYLQANLLRNMLDTADTCIVKKTPGATLRFGHEVVVLPLACLMELNHYGKSYSETDDLENLWRNYEVFPMACNIQMVYYRKAKSDDILVKVLLNEREMTLPVASDLAPYYHWKDVEAYYRAKLDAFTAE